MQTKITQRQSLLAITSARMPLWFITDIGIKRHTRAPPLGSHVTQIFKTDETHSLIQSIKKFTL